MVTKINQTQVNKNRGIVQEAKTTADGISLSEDKRPEAFVQRKLISLASNFRTIKNRSLNISTNGLPIQMMKKWEKDSGYVDIDIKPEDAEDSSKWVKYLYKGEVLYISSVDMADFPDWGDVDTEDEPKQESGSKSDDDSDTKEVSAKTLGVKVKGFEAEDVDLDVVITDVFVNGGGHIDEDHAEVLCKAGEQWIRFSRNNSEDTIQLGVDYQRSIQTYSTQWFKGKAAGKTVQDALSIFATVNSKFPIYETANCTVFANEVVKLLTGSGYKKDTD
jgi:hypothetical protein